MRTVMDQLRWLLVAVFTLGATALSPAADRPNIVLIMADDIGVEGISSYGGTS